MSGDLDHEQRGEAVRSRRQRSDAAQNYTRIFAAAAELFSREPDATVDDVALAAGVARGTVYRHFPSRADLVEAVHRQARDDAEANEDDFLRPPGELARTAPVPLDVTDVLNKVPPHQLGDQIVAEAQRVPGVASAALYLIDIDGSKLLRLAGSAEYPERVTVPLAVGPEIPREGVPSLREVIDEELPGAAAAPLYLRGRAIGVLLAVGTTEDALRDLAAHAAAAIALADEYTDLIDTVRRAQATSPAAEIQQNLLPPRIVRINGASLAGNVLPGYDIGGDWFDYAENSDGSWIGVVDAIDTGPTAAALATVVLGAFRTARHRGVRLPDAARLMHEVLFEVRIDDGCATAIIGRWRAPTSTFSWINCGHPAPVVVAADGSFDVLDDLEHPALGRGPRDAEFAQQSRRIEVGERLLLLSDGVIARPTARGVPLGVEAVVRAAAQARSSSAAATVKAIEELVRTTSAEPLEDDATVVVLSPTPPRDRDQP